MPTHDTTTFDTVGSALVRGAGVLVVRHGKTEDISLPLGLDVTVGRGETCGIRIDDPAVSRRHASLRWDGSAAVQVRDLGSHNGTWFGADRLSEAVLAGRGAELVVGPARLVVYVRPTAHGPRGTAPEIVTNDPALEDALALADRAALVDSTVLITGETGTGKELVARRIHARSERARGPLVAVNCGAIAPTLAAAELFGHERGAFTGATSARPGVFEQAAGGTLFLDEVGELPAHVQVMLLRVLSERAVVRVGGARPIALDVRVLAATHRDPEAMVRQGSLRGDLLFRLDVVRIGLPPLRARPGDIELLAERFLSELDPSGTARLTASALASLRAHTWPGNVRELRNLLEHALAEGGPEGCPRVLMRLIAGSSATMSGELDVHISAVERERIREALELAGGNRSHAARLLGITRSALLHRLRKHGLHGAD